ncbi:MAG: hypothetical protein IJI65_01715 [Lachnospiraceae bacterium]|nr:hypothetical protein [Lachnospiraceae bacterium]
MKKRVVASVLAIMLFLIACLSPSPKALAASDKADVAGSLELKTEKDITIPHRTGSDPFWYAYSFKTSGKRSYYAFTWETDSSLKPEWRVTTEPDCTTFVIRNYAEKGYQEIGSTSNINVMGAALSTNTTYYLMFKRDNRDDINVKLCLLESEDKEADTAETAEQVQPGVTKSGVINGRDDLDFFYLDTGEDTYLVRKQRGCSVLLK